MDRGHHFLMKASSYQKSDLLEAWGVIEVRRRNPLFRSRMENK